MFNDNENVHVVLPEEEVNKLKISMKQISNSHHQHSCKDCNKLVAGKQNLIDHYKKVHRLSKKIIEEYVKNIASDIRPPKICEFCQKQVSYKNFALHLRTKHQIQVKEKREKKVKDMKKKVRNVP